MLGRVLDIVRFLGLGLGLVSNGCVGCGLVLMIILKFYGGAGL